MNALKIKLLNKALLTEPVRPANHKTKIQLLVLQLPPRFL
jgi:hypothetical protein